MSRIFTFHVLFCVLYFGSSLSNASSSKWVTRIGKAPAQVKVIQTSETATACEVYKHYGVGDKETICKSADGKTRYIYGYSLCKNAVKDNEAMLNQNSKIIDAKCSWVELEKSIYIHASKKIGAGNRVGLFQKNKYPKYGHIMVECFQGKENEMYSKTTAFRLLHARKKIYYIFNEQLYYPQIVKTQFLRFDANDYPKITVEATDEDWKADDIFGHYGVMEPKDGRHVCQKDRNTNMPIGEELCKPAIAQIRKGMYKLNDMVPTCASVDLERLKPESRNFSGYTLQAKVTGIKCWYSSGPNDINSEHILITNFPSKPDNENHKDYYYVLTPKSNQTRKNITIYQLIRVEKIEIGANKEDDKGKS